jgi:HEAT repeat protein
VTPSVHLGKPRGETGRQLEPLLEQLQALGYDVESPERLPKLGRRYRDAVPVLLDWLPRMTDPAAKKSVVRALSVPWARPEAIDALVREFEASDDDVYQWAVGNALSVVADDSAFDALARFVRDKRYGKAREMVVVALGKVKNERRAEALHLLTELLDDDELSGHALLGLEKLGDARALPAVERLAESPDRLLRTRAKRAAEKLRAAKDNGRG